MLFVVILGENKKNWQWNQIKIYFYYLDYISVLYFL